MSLFRDSWEVWRRKVDEALSGLIGPIKSKDVTYSNTDSGLTSTNVQGAIDEVVGAIDSVEAKTSNSKIVSFNNSASATGDGTKTNGALLSEIATSLAGVINGLSDNQYILVNRLTISGVATLILKPFYYNDANQLSTLAGLTVGVTASTFTLWCYVNSATILLNKVDTNTSTGVSTVTDIASQVCPDGREIAITYDVYERIV